MFLLERAMVGSRRYWLWVCSLAAIALVGVHYYLRQLDFGLGLTGLNRDVTWGAYIGQFTFMVGVAASAVVIVLAYYLHNHKEFARMTVLGEFLAISAVTVCMLFVFVDMGQPMRILNVLLYPRPQSIMFWDMLSLGGYLLLNAVITFVTMRAMQRGVAPASWIKALIFISIPWAVSIHTVTAFLYSGLPGRPFWLTAIMAPRFLASAFASGPALLIILCLLLRRLAGYDVGQKALRALTVIVTYAMVLNVFFLLMELFTAFYSQIPALTEHFDNMYLGIHVHTPLLVWGRSSAILTVVSFVLLLLPRVRANNRALAAACAMTFLALWADKGVCLIVCGFMPSPLGLMTPYVPTPPELGISAGIFAVGALLVTIFYKIAISFEPQPACLFQKTEGVSASARVMPAVQP